MTTSRQRILDALNHRQPDRVPLDLGSTIVTGISLGAYRRLREALGFPEEPVTEFDHGAQLAAVSESVLRRLEIDTRGIVPGHADNFQDIVTEDGLAYTDEWGVQRSMPPGAESYFVCNAPLGGEINLNDLAAYPWPDPADPGRRRDLPGKIDAIRRAGDYAVILSLPANFILTSQLLRGFEEWNMDTRLNPDLAGALMDRVLEIQMEMCRLILGEVGNDVDIVINYDDLAMQDRLMVSPAAYRSLLEPRLRRLYEFIRKNTSAKILHHSDGAVKPLLPSLMDMGVDAINPVQVSAKGMDDLAGLKSAGGGQLTFWGGIDTQQLLPNGSPDEIRREVRRTIEILGREGGYVLASVHNLLNNVPAENIIAMYETALGRSILRTAS